MSMFVHSRCPCSYTRAVTGRSSVPLPRRGLLLAAAGVVAAGAGAAVVEDRRRRPPGPARLTLATGPQGAVFLEVGRDLARAITASSPQTRVTVRVTAATLENLQLLQARTADLGFASLDAAAVDRRVGPSGIRAVSRLYDSLLHLVVPAASPIAALPNCTGKVVSIGAVGSGTEFTCLQLLRLTGVLPARLVRLTQTPAMQAVAAGTVDAAFSLTGFPTPAITALAEQRPIRLIPLADYVDALDAGIAGVYSSAAIPEGTYRGVRATETVFLPNILLAGAGVPDGVVRLVTGALLSPGSRRYWTNPDSRRIDIRTAIATGPVPLHPAALEWLRAHKP
jgi:TRAP transporter TAXI family solute receptor